jgi:hypothetical protein
MASIGFSPNRMEFLILFTSGDISEDKQKETLSNSGSYTHMYRQALFSSLINLLSKIELAYAASIEAAPVYKKLIVLNLQNLLHQILQSPLLQYQLHLLLRLTTATTTISLCFGSPCSFSLSLTSATSDLAFHSI